MHTQIILRSLMASEKYILRLPTKKKNPPHESGHKMHFASRVKRIFTPENFQIRENKLNAKKTHLRPGRDHFPKVSHCTSMKKSSPIPHTERNYKEAAHQTTPGSRNSV